MKTWTSEQAGDETCGTCGSVYEVTITRFPCKDSDEFRCVVCGVVMSTWNDTRSPSYKLKQKGNRPGSR